jgi:DNA repair ATPase RecN
VVKDERDGRPQTTVAAVDAEERVAEIARLMSGRTTDAALARARELVEEGRVRPEGVAARTIAPR